MPTVRGMSLPKKFRKKFIKKMICNLIIFIRDCVPCYILMQCSCHHGCDLKIRKNHHVIVKDTIINEKYSTFIVRERANPAGQ